MPIMGTGAVLSDPQAMREALLWRGLDLTSPRFPKVTRRDLKAAIEGDKSPLVAKLLGPLVVREIWEQNAPPQYLNDCSYGFAVQAKSRERLAKLLGLDVQRVELSGELKAMPTDALLDAVREAIGAGVVGS